MRSLITTALLAGIAEKRPADAAVRRAAKAPRCRRVARRRAGAKL